MKRQAVSIERRTRETSITLTLDIDSAREPVIATGVPYFDHMLTAMAFHGGFGLTISATGDIEVDYHHLVEDTGLVLGQAFGKLVDTGRLNRFAQSIIPMDEALSEVVIDVCGRPTCVMNADFPQSKSGPFPMDLLEDFFIAFASTARIALHLNCRYGRNSHHMAEALFKAFGKSLGFAYQVLPGSVESMSTKGKL